MVCAPYSASAGTLPIRLQKIFHRPQALIPIARSQLGRPPTAPQSPATSSFRREWVRSGGGQVCAAVARPSAIYVDYPDGFPDPDCVGCTDHAATSLAKSSSQA